MKHFICELPYNAQVTSYMKADAPEGKIIVKKTG
jgi:hypothetical protein